MHIGLRSRTALVLALFLLAGCASRAPSAPALQRWTYAPSMLFPTDQSLARAEDGIALPDGSLIVADQRVGLRRVTRDGGSRPFGDLPGAGYANDPPRRHGAPNGISLEPDGTHLLVADVIGGEIYRVDVSSGETELLYSHPYGVNSAVRDSAGTVWFTQSAHNTEEQGEDGMFTPVDVPTHQGALLRLSFRDGRLAERAEVLVDGLQYANGIAIDEARGQLYLSELAAGRVLSFPLDVSRGRLGERRTLVEMATPDNLELDVHGRLWVTSPVRNEVLVIDLDTGSAHSVFHLQTQAQTEISDEFMRRGRDGTPRVGLLSPAICEPLPGFLTGVILARDGTVYVSGLGNALLRLDPASP